MKKNLRTNAALIVVMIFFAFSSQAQNRIHSSTDLEKILQLKKFVESHPLEKGQTNWAVEQLKSYESELAEIESSHRTFSPERNSSHNIINLVPANDDCANAILLTEGVTCTSTAGDVTGATQSFAPDSCNIYRSAAADDVWYKFVATTTNPIISVLGSINFDAVVFLFDSCGGSKLGCSDETVGGQIETVSSSGLTIGNTYYIRVYGYGSGIPSTTTFTICVYNASPPPANDNCANAISMVVSGSCTPDTGTMMGATYSGIPGCVGNSDDDVWYSFTALSASARIDLTSPSSYNKVIEAFNACGGTSIGCGNTNSFSGNETMTLTALTPGSTYYVRVYTIDSSVDTANFAICVTDLALGTNTISNQSGLISVYPNPSSGILTIDLGTSIEKSTIRLSDLVGNILKEEIIQHSSNAKLDISHLANGIYFVKVESESGLFTQKIILNR